VVDRDFDHLEAALLNARHHLDRDTAAVALEWKALEDVAAK
jgi:hypothetical protein